MNFDIIKPEFLKKLDKYLLLHYPAVWHSKIIWVAFYAVIAFAGVYFLGDFVDAEPHPEEYLERNDFAWFFILGAFLSSLIVIYWLYLQFQQKIDYGKFSFGKFLGVLALNYGSIILLFVPLLAMVYGGVLDVERDQSAAVNTWYSILYAAMPLSALPFVIRQFKLIEMVLTVFFGFLYCLVVASLSIFLNDFFGGGIMKQLPLIFILNFIAITVFVVVRLNRSDYTQQTKRLGLLLILTFPIIMPLLTFFLADLSFEPRREIKAYEAWAIGYAFVGLMLVIYAAFTRFMYRKMMFPGKK